MSANPFDLMGGGGGPQQQSDPWGSPPPKDSLSVASGHSYSSHSNIPANIYPQQQLQQQPNMGSPYGANPYGLPVVPQQPNASPPPYGSNPYGAPAALTTNGHSSAAAMVVAGNQSNPYAMPAYGHSQPPPQQQQIVTSAYQSNPYAMPATSSSISNASAAANPFDPFAKAPEPAPLPQLAIETYQPPQLDVYAPQPPSHQQLEPYHPPAEEQEQQIETYRPPAPARAASTSDGDFVNAGPPKDQPAIQETPDMLQSPEGTTYPPQFQFGQKGVPNTEADPEPPSAASPRNPYAAELARNAPPGSSPLPKAELVLKKGFVLSRISFRTIVMKKWKQTFWVQYGPHTMLWFRSQADFDDWLNNPYLMQTERNFLIKLAVNFVHDLYKPNVRGYQVTQCRTKGYGNKMVRQFKLERWMDYGPTIAAAFGSYNPAEVDALREAIVQCMRNTPLNGGIRATGAVRQRDPDHDQEYHHHDEEKNDRGNGETSRPSAMTNRMSSYDELPSDNEPPKDESAAEETDLLDVNNWDDVPVEPQQAPIEQHQPQQVPQPYAASYGSPPPHQQQPGVHEHNPFAEPAQSNAMVPVSSVTPQSYPGAPPPQQQYGQYPPQPQQQQYPGFPPHSPYGSPPPTQQGNPYGAPYQQPY